MHNTTAQKSYQYDGLNNAKFLIIFNNIIRFLGNILFIVIFALVLVVLIYNFYTKRNGTAGQKPIISAYVIISPSMVPTINVQDAVVSLKTDASKLNKGDIITFSSTDTRYPGLTVTHRIMKVLEQDGSKQYQTKGDNNTTPDDAKVLPENIFGKVVFVIPWLGYLQYFLTKTYGWLLLIVLPCVCIIIYDIIKLSSTIKRSKTTKNRKFKDVEIKDDKKR